MWLMIPISYFTELSNSGETQVSQTTAALHHSAMKISIRGFGDLLTVDTQSLARALSCLGKISSEMLTFFVLLYKVYLIYETIIF